MSKPASVRARPASAGPTASAADAKAKIAPARGAAFEILTLVGEGNGHSDELLHSSRTAGLSPEDRNLATALVMGVLRWEIALDARVATLLARPGQRLAAPVALALRIGAFQLLHMDRIPAHAALSESVEMCRAAGHPHAAGMVNAVLRKLAKPTSQRRDVGRVVSSNRHRDVGRAPTSKDGAAAPSLELTAEPAAESPAAFAEPLGHPRWLVERWVAAYGRETALAICEYDQREPQHAAIFPVAEVSGLAREAAPQMDDGSRLVAELAAVALPSTAGRAARVWDCCAAPGGKTLMLALRLPDAEILATDVSAKRLAQMAARLKRYSYAERVRCAVADTSTPSAPLEAPRDAPREAPFDLILCDVPCSGTGTLARNPEIRHRLRPEDLARQSARQRALLSGALHRLAPGGRLVYSTCSLEPEENERVVEDLASGAGLRRLPVAPLIARLADSGVLCPEVAAALLASAVSGGALRTLPGVHGCDGFFAAIFERV
jgi:16S rRNA (cytosine967-C5)-methyltransferase